MARSWNQFKKEDYIYLGEKMKAERRGEKPEKTYADFQRERTLAMIGKVEVPKFTDEEEQLNQICKHYGWKNQCDILVEECAELTQAVSKCKRNGWVDLLNRDEVDIIKKHKIMRQLERMEEETGENK